MLQSILDFDTISLQNRLVWPQMYWLLFEADALKLSRQLINSGLAYWEQIESYY